MTPRITAGYEPRARKYYLTVHTTTPLLQVAPVIRQGYKLNLRLATPNTDTLTKSRLA